MNNGLFLTDMFNFASTLVLLSFQDYMVFDDVTNMNWLNKIVRYTLTNTLHIGIDNQFPFQ